MTVQYIYLLQEREFVNSNENIYKIGRTIKENFTRFNQYPKGSKLLFQIICNDCIKIEKLILNKFKQQFSQCKNIGNEYFKGDYKNMIDIIYKTINNIDNDNDNDNVNDNKNNNVNENNNENENKYDSIKSIFPEYILDESFGGNKKFVLLKHINNKFFLHYIHLNIFPESSYRDCPYVFQFDIEENILFNSDTTYLKKILSENIINLDTVYDIKCTNFVKLLNNNKNILNIESFNDIKIKFFTEPHINNVLKTNLLCNNLFLCNTIINNSIYVDIINYNTLKSVKNNSMIKIDTFRNKCFNFSSDTQFIFVYKFKNKYFEYTTFLYKYIPYAIYITNENDYYILNHNYEYIGLKNFNNINNKIIYKTQYYLYDKCEGCIKNTDFLKKIFIKFNHIIQSNSLNLCLNSDDILLKIKMFA